MERQLLSAAAFVRDGKLFVPHREHFDTAVNAWPNTRASLTLVQDRRLHSRQLEKFYWGVCIHRICEETGMDRLDAHELMKEAWLPHRLHVLTGGAICWRCARIIQGSTKPLDRDEYWAYVSDVQRWSVQELDLILPDPGVELVAA